jgi:hypothetical protein
MKAEKVPNVRQSRFVFGLKKLKANKVKIAELMMTSDYNPYAGTSWFMTLPLPAGAGESGWHPRHGRPRDRRAPDA